MKIKKLKIKTSLLGCMGKCISRQIIAASVLSLTMAGVGLAHAAQARLNNAGFEGDSSWNLWNNEVSYSAPCAVSGKRGLRVSKVSQGGAGQALAFIEGAPYEIGASGKISTVGEYGTVGVKFTDADGNTVFEELARFGGRGFAKQSFTFVAPPADSYARSIVYVWKPDNQAEFCVDDVRVSQTNIIDFKEEVSGEKRIHAAWNDLFVHATSDSEWAPVVTLAINPSWYSQRWAIEAVGERGDLYRIKNLWTNRYLTATDTNPFSDLLLADLRPEWSSQIWKFTQVAGQYRFQNQWSKLYATSPNEAGDTMRQLKLVPEWGSQRFYIYGL